MKYSNRRLEHLMRAGCRPTGVLAGLMLLATTAVQAADIHVAAGVVLADNDDGQCSLIGAIQNANAGDSSGDSDCAAGTAGADTLILPENAHYLLQAPFEQPPFASDTGFPYVTSEITILGNGSTIEREALAAVNFRLMHVTDAGNLSLDSVTLKGGLGTGNNFAGGAIHAHGSLSIHNSTLTGNRADYGGAIFFELVSDATVAITDSVFSGNRAINGGAMYLVAERDSRHTITNTVIGDNVADEQGGGLYLNAGIFILKSSTLSGNQAAVDGGAVFVTNIGIPFGTFTRTVFEVNGSTFLHNSAGKFFGGAIVFAGTGGGAQDSTFHGNTAVSAGGAIFASEGQHNDTVTINRSTFYGNSADKEAAISFNDTQCEGGNNLFVNHASGACELFPCPFPGNISDEASCDASGAPTPGAENIGPLAFNGGPTQTHALTPGHPAIDAVDRSSLQDEFCFASNGRTIDQRGVRRYSHGTQCDVGAFEFGATFDLGDAPDPGFPSLLASNGAAHVTNNPAFASLFLGAKPPDSEAEAAQSADADGDDLSDDNDEDGVDTSFVLLIGRSNDLPVTVNGTGLLNAWVDFNSDGDWDDAGEQVASNVDVASLSGTLPVVVPGDAAAATVMSRFRVSSAGGDRVIGLANDGEVEDHPLTLEGVPACSGDDLVVSERTFASGEVISCVGNSSLSTSGSVIVGSGSEVSFQAPLTTLSSGFSVELGGNFNAGPVPM